MTRHPLEPLSAYEFRQTAFIVRRERPEVGDRFRFASIELKEPPKALVKAWRPGDTTQRTSFAVVFNREDNKTYEATVDLSGQALVSFEHIPDVTPNFTLDEYHDVDRAMRQHPEVIAKLAERGFTDMSLILVDVWTYGKAVMPEKYRQRRLGWCDLWARKTPDGNPYAHPVPGLKLIVDMNALEPRDMLLEIDEIEDDHDYVLPPVDGEYIPSVAGTQLRTDLKPLRITQPEGASFTVEGTELRWQNWTMRLGFNYREGPVIYQVTFDDHGTVRDVAYRLSFAEMVVPYRDPTFEHYRRTAYDIGEWGLGVMVDSLELGCDCLGEVTYLDATLCDTQGDPYHVRHAICLHEEDNAVLWKHVDPDTGAEVRRQRRMVVSCHATVSNYEYLIYWRFYQDGNIECEVRATGLMVTTPYPHGGEAPPYGTVVDADTYAPYHQHFIIARLDLDIDGETNTVMETDSYAPPMSKKKEEENRDGLALVTRSTPIRSEAESGRDYNWSTQRTWSVVNPKKVNKHQTRVGYKLVPGACFPAMMDPSAPQYLRAPVIGRNLWVTKYSPDERWPAGPYPTQSTVDTGGMSDWIKDNAKLEDTDVVLWYVFGLHHITRVEEWPIMPVDVVSFWLKPSGFFDRNPSLDAAPMDNGQAGACHA
jgi:primary-amine oxidase